MCVCVCAGLRQTQCSHNTKVSDAVLPDVSVPASSIDVAGVGCHLVDRVTV